MTQIATYSSADNNTSVIYTVTASKYLYLNNVTLTVYNNSGGAAQGWLFITNPSDVTQNLLFVINLADGLSMVATKSFPKGYRVVAGWKIKVLSNAAGLTAYANIHGFEM